MTSWTNIWVETSPNNFRKSNVDKFKNTVNQNFLKIKT